jgi:hypothetical protein
MQRTTSIVLPYKQPVLRPFAIIGQVCDFSALAEQKHQKEQKNPKESKENITSSPFRKYNSYSDKPLHFQVHLFQSLPKSRLVSKKRRDSFHIMPGLGGKNP